MHRGEMLRLRRKAKREALYTARRAKMAGLSYIQRKLLKALGITTKRCHLR